MTGWAARATAIVASMLEIEPDAGLERAGGWPHVFHEAVVGGLDADILGRIAHLTGWTLAEVCDVVGLPVGRAAAGGRLSAAESERLLRVAWISAAALVALDGSQAGRSRFAPWSRRPYDVLDGHTPMELMATTPGSRWLRDALDAWLRGFPSD